MKIHWKKNFKSGKKKSELSMSLNRFMEIVGNSLSVNWYWAH